MTTWKGNRLFRWGIALGLGGLAAWVNSFSFPILTPETPHFVVGGAFVLVAFATLGIGPGLLAALVSISSFPLAGQWGVHPAAALGSGLHILEPLAVFLLYRRIRSLPLAAAVFWLGGGWVLTLLVYHFWLGLAFAYVALFLVKQVLNGLLNALAAELFLGPRVQGLVLRLRGMEPSPPPVEAVAFRGMVLLTLVPITILGLFLVRAQYEEVIRDVNAVSTDVGWEVAAEMDRYLRERHALLTGVARAAAEGLPAPELQAELDLILEAHPEFYLVGVVDAEGRITQASPEHNVHGEPLAGVEIRERDYFARARSEREITHGRILMGGLRVRAVDDEPAVVIAHPLLDPDGSFRGAAVGSLDPRIAAREIDLATPLAGRRVTLFDSDGRVIGSTAPGRSPATPVEALVRGPGGAELDPFPLADRSRPTTLRYFPPRDGSRESRLHANLVHGSFQPVPGLEWSLLVDTPASLLWGGFLPVAYQILAFVVLVLGFLVLGARRVSRWIALPLRDASRYALRIARGEFQPIPADSPLRTSPLSESQDLGRSLERMRQTLEARDRATRERQRDLEAQLLQAQKMEAVGLLAGGIAHDFNNMLTPIVGLAGLGQDEAESQELRTQFQEISDAALRARDIVQQLLAFSRKQVLSMGPTDLEDEVERSRNLLRSLLPENIEVLIQSGGGRHVILADPAQIQQVLVNLAVNAKDAMPRGGLFALRLGDVPEGEPELAEEGLEGRPLVRLTVTDSGKGIPPDDLPRIFDPFFTTKDPGHGTGLGLSTVYGIVRQHGGAIRVQSTQALGTTFQISFPATDQPLRTSRRTAPGAPARNGVAGGERILLVEDDEAIRRFVRRILERQGYRVTVAGAAEEAIALAEGGDEFDMLLTDVVLPGLNGRELFERLSARYKGLRALFISGHSHDVLGDGGPPAGTRFLPKPFELPDLLAQVREVLDGR